MNVIAFLGSPRKGGNTEVLLQAAIEGTGMDVKVYRLNDMDFRACQNCGGCEKSARCILKDDLSPVLEEAIPNADRIILATPVYFMGPSAQAKALIDRVQCFWCGKYLLEKPIAPGPLGRKGLLLAVAGMKKDKGIQTTETIATAFFRTISVPEHKTLSYIGIDAKGDMAKHQEALEEARQAGKALVAT